MIFVHISTEFAADESEPAAEFSEWVPLHPSFAVSAEEAHAKLTHLLATESYFEVPTADDMRIMPLNTETVRQVVVREG